MLTLQRKWVWGVVIVAIVVLGFWATRSTGMENSAMPSNASMSNQGEPAPQFQLKNLKGQSVSLSDFKGEKKVYVKYWASWCPICLAGLDELNQLSGEQHDYKVITIVSPDYKGEQSEADFVSWFSKRGYDNIEVLLDDGGTWAKQFGVKGYPSSYYIGSDSQLVKSVPGHQSNEIIEATFQSIH